MAAPRFKSEHAPTWPQAYGPQPAVSLTAAPARRRRLAVKLSFNPVATALTIYTGLYLSIVLTGADRYLFYQGILPLPPIRFFVAGALPLLALVAFNQTFKARNGPGVFSLLIANAYIVAPFCAIILLGLLYTLHPTANWGADNEWVKAIGFNALVFFSALLLPLLRPVRRRFEFVVTASLLLLLASIALDVIAPGTLSKQTSRAAGFAINANLSALLIVFLAALAVRFDGYFRGRDIFLLTAAGIGILMTLSRSGMLEYGLLLSLYIFFNLKRRGLKLKKILFIFFGAATALTLLYFGLPWVIESSEMFATEGAQRRLAALSGERKLYSGDDARLAAARASMRLINGAPLLGHGTGYSYEMVVAPHNLYLQQWINNGLAGLVTLLLFFSCCGRTFRRRNYLNGTCFIWIAFLGSFFSHGLLDHRPFLVLIAMMTTISWLRQRGLE